MPRKTCLHTHRHLLGVHTLTHIFNDTQTTTLPPPHPRPPSWCSSCTIIATVIHRCWILLASHKTWYAWFVQSARSVISFSFSFIFPSWATRSIFLLYESADTQRDFQDDYMPCAMGGLRSQHASLRAVLNLGENIYLNKFLNIWTARGALHLSYQNLCWSSSETINFKTNYQVFLIYIFLDPLKISNYVLNIFAQVCSLLSLEQHRFKTRTHALMVLWALGKINQAYLTWLMYLRWYSYTQSGLMSQLVGGSELQCPPGETERGKVLPLSLSLHLSLSLSHTHRLPSLYFYTCIPTV